MKKKIFILENGLKLITIQRKKLPITYIKLIVRSGAINEPLSRKGTSYLTAKLLNEGTKEKDSTAFAREVEKLGGDLTSKSGYSISTIEGDSLSDKFEALTGLIKELLTGAAFREKDLSRLKKQIKTGFLLRMQDPNYVSLYYFTKFMYKDYPLLSTLPEGTPESVEKIKRNEIIKFFKDHYTPTNSFIVVVSDIGGDRIAEIIHRALSGWIKEAIEKPKLEQIPDVTGPTLYIVDMDVTQSHIKIGRHSISRANPDYNSLRVANYILGGSDFSSRLMRKIRIEKGLAYSVYSSITPGYPTEPQPLRGSFYISMETSTENTRKAFDLLLKEVKKFTMEGPSKEELEDAKSYYHGNIPLRSETYEQLAVLAMDEELFGLPWKHWIKDVEEIERLDRTKVQETASKYLNLEHYVALIVGNAQKLLPQFKDLHPEVIKPRFI